MLSSTNTQQRSLGLHLAQAQAASNILGRLTVLRDSARKTKAPLRFNGSSRLVKFSAQDTDASVYTSFDLPSTGAIEYLRSLTPVTKSVFDGLTKQYQVDSFTMAGISDTRVLGRIRDEVTEILQHGGTATDFRAAVAKLRTDAGVEQLSAAEIDNLFQGLTHKAYAAGRYEQLTDASVVDALPYWQYWTVGDDRVRPEHRVLDGFCALSIDPVWMKIYPPCGYGCRCSAVALSKAEAPEGSDEGGIHRLPALAIALVPQPGYNGIFAGLGKAA